MAVQFGSAFDEFISIGHPLEFCGCYENKSAILVLINSFFSGGDRLFAFEQIAIDLKHLCNQCSLANTRRPNDNERLVLEGCGVEWVEVFLCVYKNIILIHLIIR